MSALLLLFCTCWIVLKNLFFKDYVYVEIHDPPSPQHDKAKAQHAKILLKAVEKFPTWLSRAVPWFEWWCHVEKRLVHPWFDGSNQPAHSGNPKHGMWLSKHYIICLLTCDWQAPKLLEGSISNQVQGPRMCGLVCWYDPRCMYSKSWWPNLAFDECLCDSTLH